jgi:hypothetical protein
MKNLTSTILTCLVAVAAADSHAVEFHGVLSNHYSGRLDAPSDANLAGGDFIWAEERAQLKVSGGGGAAGFFGKIDLNHDHYAGRSGMEIREAYLNYTVGQLDLRLGRQVVTWGIGDMVFINDVFPKDYNAFFSGRSTEYLKGAISGLKAGVYSGIATVDAVVTPFFEPNRMPDPARYSYADPFAGIADRTTELPEASVENSEVALRISRPVLSWDVAVYGFHGHSRTPAVALDPPTAPTRLAYVFPELNTLGLSGQGSAFGGILGCELGYYDSPWDRSGNDPLVPNSEYRYLAGYQFAPWTDFTAGIQYYGELMVDHANYVSGLPPGFPAKNALRQLLVGRLTRFLEYQTLKLSLLAFYCPTDRDYYLVPEATYKVSDEMTFAFGGNLFDGAKAHTEFAQMNANDNVYLGARYEF